MVDTMASPVVETLIKFLQDEATLFKGVHKEVTSLQRELNLINCLLKDVELRSEEEMSNTVRAWMRHVREEAHGIVDVLDEYHHIMAKPDQNQSGFLGFFSRTVRIVKDLKPRHKVAFEIQKIKESLNEIKSSGEAFGVRPLKQGSISKTSNVQQHDPRWRSSVIEESELVGISSLKGEVMKNLIEGPSKNMVISLAGTGGIGKTTLVKIIYNKEEVQQHFESCAWTTVSRAYDREKLLGSMIQQICKSPIVTIGQNDVIPGLIQHLSRYLKRKRYLLVFYDVWDQSLIETMKLALPSNNNGSRIIMTTRNDAIVEAWKEITSYVLVQKLPLLSENDAWDLFCKKAFQSTGGGQCPEELKQVSREIIRRCNGLPLAIATTAGLLSTKEKTEFEWTRQLDRLKLGFESDPHLSRVSEILNLSFHDLPYHLKCCFLYFGIFPQDFSIGTATICEYWIAEGFIQEERGQSLEEVAEAYLDELIKRNLVSKSTEGTCSIHDLVHETIISRYDPSFCQILDDKKSNFNGGKCRRLSIYNSARNVLDYVNHPGVRSVFLFRIKELPNNFLICLFERCKLLKVLRLSHAQINELPKEVGNLFHLKYLDVSYTEVRVIPKSVGKLHNLQTLILINTLVEELPKEIKKLRNLRHLLAYSVTKVMDQQHTYDRKNGLPKKIGSGVVVLNHGVRIHKGIGCLEQLQTLIDVEAHPSDVGVMKELENLKQLKRLRISKVTSEVRISLFTSIMKMTHLRELEIRSFKEDELLDVQSLSSPPPFLEYLELWGPLKDLPDWMPKLQVLQALYLHKSRLTYDPLKCIHILPNLTLLVLQETFDGGELHFKEGGFQKLNELRLIGLVGLKVVKIERGAISLLEKLVIQDNPELKEVPSDIQHLTNLKSLEIIDMPREFVLEMQPDQGGQYCWKVNRIPLIRILYEMEEERAATSTN